MRAPLIKNDNLQKLIWPLMALGIILLFNMLFTPGFFHMEIKDGHLFGSLVDIVNRGAPVMLLSIGMTLVFATGGIDLSVGAVMAISGALAATIIRPDYVKGVLAYGELRSLFIVVSIPLILSVAAGLWNGILVAFVGIQPYSHGGRPRNRPAHYPGADCGLRPWPLPNHWKRIFSRSPFSHLDRHICGRGHLPDHAQNGHGPVHRGRGR